MAVGLRIQYSTEPAQPFGDARADRGRALADCAGENKGVKPLQRGRKQAGVETGAVSEVLDSLFCSQKTSRRTVVTRIGEQKCVAGIDFAEMCIRDSIELVSPRHATITRRAAISGASSVRARAIDS